MPAYIKGSLGLDAASKVQNTITNTATTPAIAIDQNGNTGSAASGGALFIENTGNADCAISVYTTMNNTSGRPLVRFHAQTGTFDQQILFLFNAGSAAALYIESQGSGPDIQIVGRPTASIADAGEGSLAYDTTLHKLKVRGAAGWETVNSA